jgi:hypothetical protein
LDEIFSGKIEIIMKMKKDKKQIKKKRTKIEYFVTPYHGLKKVEVHFKKDENDFFEHEMCWLLEAQDDYFIVLVWYTGAGFSPHSINIFKLDSKKYYYIIKS